MPGTAAAGNSPYAKRNMPFKAKSLLYNGLGKDAGIGIIILQQRQGISQELAHCQWINRQLPQPWIIFGGLDRQAGAISAVQRT